MMGRMLDPSSIGYEGFPQPPTFETKELERQSFKERLAQMFRIFDHRGYNENSAGNITIRDPVHPETFWVNPSDTHWSLIQPADLLHVDRYGAILADSGPSGSINKDAFLFHVAIHEHRSDVVCVAHTQPPHGMAFSHQGRELDILTQDSCAFYEDNAVYEGVMRGEEGGRGAAAALGRRKALFLKNNGFLIAAGSIEAATYFFISCEKCCQVQSLADLAAAGREFGPPHKIGEEEALETWKLVGAERSGFFSAWPEFQALAARERVRN
ncbi:class II aldolase/adducin family protein [Ramaria rubella]|nr:class II aldolase/adducin family protein [Ramaria rubella]